MASKQEAQSSKRKRAAGAEESQKRRRSVSSEEDENEDPKTQILLMEQGILESKKNYNDVATLIETASGYEDDTDAALLASVALCRVFVRLIAQGSLSLRKGLSDKDVVVVRWLRDQLSACKDVFLTLLMTDEFSETSLTLSMRILKAEGEHMGNKDEYSFPNVFLQDIVAALLRVNGDSVRQTYMEEYAEGFDDIRYFTFKSIKSAIEKGPSEGLGSSELFDRAFKMLSALDGVPESADELEDFYVPKPSRKTHDLRIVNRHKKQGQEAWLALLRSVDTKDQRKRLLDIMSTIIAPWFSKPELLADFLTNSYDQGGSMSLLALSGVFYLIQERNLDYPSFYHKLYSLLDSEILHSKHRSRFFRLLDTFLASTHLPAALVASFIKRLARLSLNAPPSAIVFVIPWIYNQMRRHPTCTFMIHREINDPEVKRLFQEEGYEDPFVPEETDPMQTEAIESCLWEVVQLQSHYHPNVATIAKVLSEQFTKQTYNMEDFLDHSYHSLLDAEMGKPLRKTPVVEFHIPKRVLLPTDDPAVNPDSLLVKLWGF